MSTHRTTRVTPLLLLTALPSVLGCQAQEGRPAPTAPMPVACSGAVAAARPTLADEKTSPERQVEEVLRLAAAYRATVESAGPVVAKPCRDELAAVTRELALRLHKRAQKGKDREAATQAERTYRAYLDALPETPDGDELRYFHGEVLWTLERWREAGEAYDRVAGAEPAGKYTEEAAYSAVLAWKNHVDATAPATAGPTPGGQRGPKPLPEAQAMLVRAMDTYLRRVPDAPEAVKIRYRKARLHYDLDRFEDAVPLFQEIVDQHADNELAIYSANLLLDSLNLLGRVDEFRRWLDRLSSTPSLMADEGFARTMGRLKTDAARVHGGQDRSTGPSAAGR